MTSISAWAGVDTRGPSSLYIASDSRISWGRTHHWDHGRKTFSGVIRPHIFGYWGDVLFPALALPVVVEKMDRGLLPDVPASESVVFDELRAMWHEYPRAERRELGILHGHRRHSGMQARFSLALLRYDGHASSWSKEDVAMPAVSSVLVSEGSGQGAMRHAHSRWQASPHGSTSRAAFSALCDSIRSGTDPQSGGAPQLVGLWRGRGAGESFGTVAGGRPFFAGSVQRATPPTDRTAFFNELFERADPATGKRIKGAQHHQQI